MIEANTGKIDKWISVEYLKVEERRDWHGITPTLEAETNNQFVMV